MSIVSEEPEEPNCSYDPMFSSLDDNFILLIASDNMRYKIHSGILSATSGFFRDMITLPQTSNGPDSITLCKTSKVMGILLRMISGLEVVSRRQTMNSVSL